MSIRCAHCGRLAERRSDALGWYNTCSDENHSIYGVEVDPIDRDDRDREEDE